MVSPCKLHKVYRKRILVKKLEYFSKLGPFSLLYLNGDGIFSEPVYELCCPVCVYLACI